MAAVADRAGRHVAAAPVHPAVQAAEDDACRDADVVVSMLPKVHEHMARTAWTPRKLHIVPNGIDPDEWQARGAGRCRRRSPRRSPRCARAAHARGRLCRLARRGQRAGHAARRRRAAARRAVRLRAGRRRPREGARCAARRAPKGWPTCACSPRSQGADPGAAGALRHRLHRLAARSRSTASASRRTS